MSAKEMFEALGYELDSTYEVHGHLYYFKGNTKIDFDLNRKTFHKYNLNGFGSAISARLLQAINKQILELGWLEDVKD